MSKYWKCDVRLNVIYLQKFLDLTRNDGMEFKLSFQDHFIFIFIIKHVPEEEILLKKLLLYFN